MHEKNVDFVESSVSEGVRIASSNAVEDLILEDFKLSINNKEFIVKTPERTQTVMLSRLFSQPVPPCWLCKNPFIIDVNDHWNKEILSAVQPLNGPSPGEIGH